MVPKMSQLRPGVAVNIVLKKDQPTGKLTNGTIADILTRGDHPRGIKVRLQGGYIGRVQSLSTTPSQPRGESSLTSPTVMQSFPTMDSPSSAQSTASPGSGTAGPPVGGGGRYRMQNDYRLDPTPQESVSLSLEDYIKPAKKKKGKGKGAAKEPEDVADLPEHVQAKLEGEFPNLDTSLIAAILVDHSTLKGAREVLGALS